MIKRFFLSIAMLASVFACSPFIETQVTSHSNLKGGGANNLFYVAASDKQETSAEFYAYAKSVSNRLNRKGWRRVMEPDGANYFVFLDYGVSGSSVSVSTSNTYGQVGGGYSNFNATGFVNGSMETYSGSVYTQPTFGKTGTITSSSEEFHRYFQIKILDRNMTPAYESNAASSGSNSTFGPVAECIFDQALESFPYSSSKRGVIKMEICGQ